MMSLNISKVYLCLALVLGGVSAGLAFEKPPLPEAANLEIAGVLVCLDGTLKETACSTTPEILGLKTTAGKIYPLKKHENVEALFVEKRLQTREFRLTLRKAEPPSPWFELVKAQFIRGGKTYDFHYFCEVCNITTHAPGICLCCREPTEYRERLAE
jgi:hypothetical protein